MALLSFLRRNPSVFGRLRRALAQDELEARYLPLVALETNRCAGAEAVVVWRDADGRELRPALLKGLAEHNGLAAPFARFLMDRIAGDLAGALKGERDLRFSLDVSPAQLADGSLAADLEQVFGPLDALGKVAVEIDEPALIDHPLLTKGIGAAQELGVKVGVDNLGTGALSLDSLFNLGLDYLNIAPLYVQTAGSNAATAQVAESLAAHARLLAVEAVGLGVEHPDQAEYLAERGVALGQGWLYGKPMTAQELLSFIGDSSDLEAPAEATSAARAS